MSENTLMTKLTPDILEKLQLTQIEILEEIVRICEKYHLRYFMIYGTLIGAIRHQGFIPWSVSAYSSTRSVDGHIRAERQCKESPV